MNGKDKNNVLVLIKSKCAEVSESMKVQWKRFNNIEKTAKIKIYGTQNDITIHKHTYAYNFNR
jgi:hypothetical protein